ncbi:TonB-dependent receptor [Maribellus mangrovi]|uniref:TonB-dependent receptor n=1 Tax=Maribellus mangrovi TaxID=3133146 RepID=UPI0030EEA4F1
MRRFVFVIVLLITFRLSAQETPQISDTIQLGEVVSYGHLQKFQSGAKIEKISGAQYILSQDGNLEQLLTRSLPIAFKSDAGGLSTIRIRGTAANHTSVNFGGIDLNSLTLGQSNFNNIPVFLFDEIGVQFGSASSVNGSGSIGGAIHLGLINRWTDGFKLETRVSHGSFGEQLYGTKIFAGNGKFESVSRAYYYYKKNDFPFLNNTYRDFENNIFEIEDVQKNASIEKYGLLQELNYRFAENEFFTLNVWLENNWRQNQQNMQTNLNNPDFSEDYEDKHIRIWAGYKNRKNPFKFEINGGYVFDDAVNNGSTKDTIRTQRAIAEAFVEHDFRSDASYKIGAKAERIFPEVYAYSSSLEKEDRVDFYASYYQRFFRKLSLTLNLRQGFVTDFNVPFTPSVGLNYLVVSKEYWVLRFLGSVARSYRVPTFNDRFWIPGGNPDLDSEKGINYELGTKWSYCNGDISGNLKINGFYLNIEDWILWKNGGSFWYAENVQKVKSRGLEVMTAWSYKLFGLPATSGLNYSLTSTKRIESQNNTNAINRQMEYVPLHSGNCFTTIQWNDLDFTIDGSYTGEQYIDEEDRNVLDAYILFNTSVAYDLEINSANRFIITGAVNNLLDVDYQSSWGYAMPGISYRLGLTYKFN